MRACDALCINLVNIDIVDNYVVGMTTMQFHVVLRQRGWSILVSVYYQNYCINSTQILHNTKDQQVLIMGGPDTCPTNPTWWTAAILKTVKSPCLFSETSQLIFIEFGKMAPIGPLQQSGKFWICENLIMRAAAILENRKIAISEQWLDSTLRNLAW